MQLIVVGAGNDMGGGVSGLGSGAAGGGPGGVSLLSI